MWGGSSTAPPPASALQSLLKQNFRDREARVWILEEFSEETFLYRLKPKWRIVFSPVNHKWLGITRGDREAWAKAYKAVDIEEAILQAGEWLVTHPERDKLDYAAFLGNWISREQRSGGRFRGGQGGAGPKPGWAAARERKP